ncbi:unnamed protein product [Fraxinus pennsylvanica]|uniref:Uncharacterized protein n=1 Tax=Fraxinus pennsylvanica TaxID=56036 RepID=A0AAD1ZVK9_9LAMI|nr:unnamed protein product [Fraxinus pennsylvanica]
MVDYEWEKPSEIATTASSTPTHSKKNNYPSTMDQQWWTMNGRIHQRSCSQAKKQPKILTKTDRFFTHMPLKTSRKPTPNDFATATVIVTFHNHHHPFHHLNTNTHLTNFYDPRSYGAYGRTYFSSSKDDFVN